MKTEKEHPFLKRLAAKCVPVRLRFELTRRCNLACFHCKVHLEASPENELTAAEIGNLLDQTRALGTTEISITGGEVFARPDIADVLGEVFSRDFLLHIQTNGAGLTREHIALLAANSKRIIRVSSSVYAADPETHDSITRTPGSHARTLGNVFAMREAGIPIFCFTLLMKQNAAQAGATRSFYEKNDLPYQFNTFIIPRDDGCTSPLSGRVPHELLPELPVDWYSYLNPAGEESPAEFGADATLGAWCPAARFAVVTATGDVIACSLLRESAGNIREKPFAEIWRDSPVLKRVREIRLSQLECFSCDLFPTCKPCVGLSLLEHGDLFRRPAEMCRISRAMLQGAPNARRGHFCV